MYTKCESTYCLASSSLHWIRHACSWRLDRSLVHCRLGRPRENRVRSPGQTVQVQRNWSHKRVGFIDMFLCRLFLKTGRPCPACCLATQTENIWGVRREGGGGGEPPASSLAGGKPRARCGWWRCFSLKAERDEAGAS